MLLLFGGGTAIILLLLQLVHLFGLPLTGVKGEYAQHADSAVANMQVIADQQKDFISLWFSERIGDLKVLAAQTSVRDGARFAAAALRGRSPARGGSSDALRAALTGDGRLKQVLQQMELLRSAYGVYEAIDLVDAASGLTAASTDGAGIGTRYPLAGLLFPEGGASWDQKIAIVRMPGEDQTSFLLAATIRLNEDSQPVGAVVFKIPTETLLQQTLSAERTWGASGEIVLIDMQKTLLTPLKHPLPDGSTAEPLKYRLQTRSAGFAAWGVDSLVETVDYRGVPVVSVVRHLRITPDFAISMIVNRDRQELFAPVRKGLVVSVLVSCLGLASTLVLVLVVSRQLAR